METDTDLLVACVLQTQIAKRAWWPGRTRPPLDSAWTDAHSCAICCFGGGELTGGELLVGGEVVGVLVVGVGVGLVLLVGVLVGDGLEAGLLGESVGLDVALVLGAALEVA